MCFVPVVSHVTYLEYYYFSFFVERPVQFVGRLVIERSVLGMCPPPFFFLRNRGRREFFDCTCFACTNEYSLYFEYCFYVFFLILCTVRRI